jgi:hypothetical protein
MQRLAETRLVTHTLTESLITVCLYSSLVTGAMENCLKESAKNLESISSPLFLRYCEYCTKASIGPRDYGTKFRQTVSPAKHSCIDKSQQVFKIECALDEISPLDFPCWFIRGLIKRALTYHGGSSDLCDLLHSVGESVIINIGEEIEEVSGESVEAVTAGPSKSIIPPPTPAPLEVFL